MTMARNVYASIQYRRVKKRFQNTAEMNLLPHGKSTTDQPTDQPTERTTDRSTHRTDDRPTDRPSDQPTDFPNDQPTGEPSNRPTERPTDQPYNPPSDRRAADRRADQPSDQTTNRPTIHPTERPIDRPTDRPDDRLSNRPTYRDPPGRRTNQPTIQPNNRATEPTDRSADRLECMEETGYVSFSTPRCRRKARQGTTICVPVTGSTRRNKMWGVNASAFHEELTQSVPAASSARRTTCCRASSSLLLMLLPLLQLPPLPLPEHGLCRTSTMVVGTIVGIQENATKPDTTCPAEQWLPIEPCVPGWWIHGQWVGVQV